MPELPEIESLRQSLTNRVVGRRVVTVKVLRSSVIIGHRRPPDLLCGLRVVDIDRHGKQLAIIAKRVNLRKGSPGRPCVCIHLGMSGSLQCLSSKPPSPPQTIRKVPVVPPHVHVVWTLDDGVRLEFRDPRRFGGVWTFPSTDALWLDRWDQLGPDAVQLSPKQLYHHFKKSRRPIKSALLDQHVTAGLGNIYVDELLFACGLHPLKPCNTMCLQDVQQLIRRLRTLLRRAITNGGSTFRNYVNADGKPGRFQTYHQVYGRGGLPCAVCQSPLVSICVSGRTTVFCSRCQIES